MLMDNCGPASLWFLAMCSEIHRGWRHTVSTVLDYLMRYVRILYVALWLYLGRLVLSVPYYWVLCCCFINGDGGWLTVHSGLVVVLVPWSTNFLSFMTNMINLFMKYVHPWLYIMPTNSRALDGNAGKMCAFLESSGREGRSSWYVCDDWIIDPFIVLTNNSDEFVVY